MLRRRTQIDLYDVQLRLRITKILKVSQASVRVTVAATMPRQAVMRLEVYTLLFWAWEMQVTGFRADDAGASSTAATKEA